MQNLFEGIGLAILNLDKNNKNSYNENGGENTVEKSIVINRTKHNSLRKKKERCCG